MHLIVGCGYLGRRVAALWRDQGKRVSALTRSRPEELRAVGVEPVAGDVLRRETLTALPPAQVVLYAVGFDRSAGASFRDVYVRGLGNVLAALPGEPRRFVYVSSTSVYGHTGGEEVDETAATEPADESGKTLLEAEALLRERLPPAVVLRFAGLYGPGRLLRRAALEKGEPLIGDPEKWLNLIHVQDGAWAVLAAEEKARPGEVYHVSDGHPVRRREFYSHLAELLGTPTPRFEPLPAGAPVPPPERANRRIVNRRLREELGVKPRYPSYREGLPGSLD